MIYNNRHDRIGGIDDMEEIPEQTLLTILILCILGSAFLVQQKLHNLLVIKFVYAKCKTVEM